MTRTTLIVLALIAVVLVLERSLYLMRWRGVATAFGAGYGSLRDTGEQRAEQTARVTYNELSAQVRALQVHIEYMREALEDLKLNDREARRVRLHTAGTGQVASAPRRTIHVHRIPKPDAGLARSQRRDRSRPRSRPRSRSQARHRVALPALRKLLDDDEAVLVTDCLIPCKNTTISISQNHPSLFERFGRYRPFEHRIGLCRGFAELLGELLPGEEPLDPPARVVLVHRG